MAIATAPISTEPTYTAEDYLQQEVQQETRNEYRNGEIVPMSGGTPPIMKSRAICLYC